MRIPNSLISTQIIALVIRELLKVLVDAVREVLVGVILEDLVGADRKTSRTGRQAVISEVQMRDQLRISMIKNHMPSNLSFRVNLVCLGSDPYYITAMQILSFFSIL